MNSYQITPSTAAVASAGAHDDFLLTVSVVKNKFDPRPVNRLYDLKNFKADLLAFAAYTAQTKNDLSGFLASTYETGTITKSQDFALYRQVIFLDFDEAPDLAFIANKLKGYVFYAWTTHSHQAPNKGNRYRVALPLTYGVNLEQWKQQCAERVKAWLIGLGFVDANKVDSSAFTFAQAAYFPAVNPAVGYVELVFNDAAGTEILSLDDLPKLADNAVTRAKALAQAEIEASIANWKPDSKQVQIVINSLKNNPKLRCIPANPTVGDAGINRKTIAAALHSIGAAQADFAVLDAVMQKPGTNTSTAKAWSEAARARNKHPGLILKLLAPAERAIVGLSTNVRRAITDQLREKWDEERTVQFITRADYSTAKRVLVNADMGTGKNYVWSQHRNTAEDRAIVLSPLRSIVWQQGSNNSVHEEDNVTFTYDQSKNIIKLIEEGKIDPTVTTLVVDECHNFQVADYRVEALTNVERLLSFDFKQVIFQSATIAPDSFNGFYSFDKHLRFRKAGGAALEYTMINVASGNIESAIFSLAVETFHNNPDGKMLILWNNIDYMTRVKVLLKQAGYTGEIVSAEKIKDASTEAYRLANDSDYTMQGVQIMFGTTSLVEGVNIKDAIDVGTVIIVGKEPPQYIKQMCGRFRNAKSVQCWHLTLADEQAPKDIEEWKQEKLALRTMAADILEVMKKHSPAFSIADHLAEGAFRASAKQALPWLNFNALVFDTETNDYKESKFDSLFRNSELEMLEFYSDREYAQAVMRGMDFNDLRIPKGIKFVLCADDKKDIKEITTKTDKKMIKRRASELEPLIAVIKQQAEGGADLDHNAVRTLTELEYGSMIPIGSLLAEALGATGLMIANGQSAAYILNQLDRLINKRTSVEAINVWQNAVQAQTSIQSELLRRYPKGTVLTVEQQRGVIREVVEYEMQRVRAARPTYSVEQAFEEAIAVKSLARFAAKGQISLVNGAVQVDVERPFKAITANWLVMENDQARVGKKVVKVGRVV